MFSRLLLLYLLILQGSSIEDVDSLGYTAKEINSVSGLHTYTAIATCYPTSLNNVTTALQLPGTSYLEIQIHCSP